MAQILNPDYEVWRRKTLLDSGFDPEQYDIDDDGLIIPIEVEPAPEPAPIAAAPQESGRSATGSFLKSALYNLPEAAGGILGAGGLAALSVAAAPATFGQSLWGLVPALAGGVGGGYLAGRAKNALMPESIQQEMAATQEEFPISSTLGALASQGPFLRPSIRNVRNAANFVLGRNLTGPNVRAGTAPLANLLNVGVGATIGGGVPLVEGMFSDEPINWTQVGLGAAGGALFSEPTKLGTRLSFGQFKPTPNYRARAPQYVLEGEALHEASSESNTPGYYVPEVRVSEEPGPAGRGLNLSPIALESVRESGLLGERLMLEANDPLGTQIMDFFAQQTRKTPKARAAEEAKIRKELGVLREEAVLGDPVAQDNINRLQQELRMHDAYRRFRAKLGEPIEHAPWEYGEPGTELTSGELNVIPGFRSKFPVQGRTPEVYTPQDTGLSTEKAADFERARIEESAQALQSELEAGQIPPQDNLRESRSYMRTLGKAEPRSEAEIIQDELEGTGAKYQEEPPTTPEDLRSKFEREQLPPTTRAWYDFLSRWGLNRLGAKSELVETIPGAAPGKVRTGKMVPGSRGENPAAEALYTISRDANWNTAPHEMLHILLDDVRRTGTASERKLLDRMLREFGWDGKGDPAAFEETLVQQAGENFTDLLLNPKSSRLRDDFASWLDQFRKSTTPRRYARMLAEWLQSGRTPFDDATMARISGRAPIESEKRDALQESSPNDVPSGESSKAVQGMGAEVRNPNESATADEAKAKFQETEIDPTTQEKIIGTAIKYKGKVYTGDTPNEIHAMIADKIATKLNTKDAKIQRDLYYSLMGRNEDEYNNNAGFVTNTGRFLNREEAAKVAQLVRGLPRMDSAYMDSDGNIRPMAQGKYQEVTETPEFKKWFGESKVVDQEGKPLRVYHGTTKDGISIFHDKTHFGTENVASNVALGTGPEKSIVYPVYLNIRNPKRVSDEGTKIGWNRAIAKAKQEGYDGIVYKNMWEPNTRWEEKITPENRYSDSYIAFYPTQIKSATGNRGTFDPTNPDIRYQETAATPIDSNAAFKPARSQPFAGVVDRLRKAGFKSTADTILQFGSAERQLVGRYYNPVIEAVDRLSPEEAEKLRQVLVKELRTKKEHSNELSQHGTLQAYDAVRATLRQMAEDQKKSGQKLITGDVRGVNPTYYPQVVSQEIRTILTEGQKSPQFERLRREFIEHQKSQGLGTQEATEKFRNWLGSFDQTKGKGVNLEFDPVNTPEGTGVPDSWLEKDLKVALGRYIRAFSRARAEWQTMDTNPAFRASVNEKQYYKPHVGWTDIPPAILAKEGLESNQVSRHPAYEDFVNYLGGRHMQRGRLFQGLGALVNSLLLGGPLTKLTDIATTPLKMIALVPPQHQGAIIRGIADWRMGFENAFKTGFARHGGHLVMQDVLGATEQLNSRLMRAADAVTKYTGSEKLEQVGRGLAQSIGEYVGDVQRTLALSGDAKAATFLDKLGTDWRSISREELGTRIGQIAQGKYDITNLPPWLYNSPVAPFLTMMKWSTEQFNNFNNYVLKPVKESGDWWPLIATVLSGIGGGLGLEQLRAELSNRKQNTATMRELTHAKGREGYFKELIYKAISAAQISGTAGILGEVTRQAYETVNGMVPQGFRYPLISVTEDITNRLISAGKALRDGEQVMSVLPQLLADVGTTHVQALRFVVNQAARIAPASLEVAGVNPVERIQQMNQSRDQRVYNRLSGLPSEVGPRVFPEYRTLTERRFDRTKDLTEAQQLSQSLLNRALSHLQDNPDLAASRLRSAATVPNRLMPSYKTNPSRFMDYYQWIEQTQGAAAAQDLFRQYMEREALGQAKRQMIPQLSR